eukprot:COSAG05_NODE_5478_length_1163_cov_0.963346_1_plen_183_part_10
MHTVHSRKQHGSSRQADGREWDRRRRYGHERECEVSQGARHSLWNACEHGSCSSSVCATHTLHLLCIVSVWQIRASRLQDICNDISSIGDRAKRQADAHENVSDATRAQSGEGTPGRSLGAAHLFPASRPFHGQAVRTMPRCGLAHRALAAAVVLAGLAGTSGGNSSACGLLELQPWGHNASN